MKRITSIAALLSASVISMAQVQMGYVKTNGRPNKPGLPLEGVVVRTMGNTPSLSDKNGNFSIAMPGKKGGDPFILTNATLKGYELADKGSIGRQYGFSDKVQFAITMVSQEELQAEKKRIRDNAYAVAQKEYASRLEGLEKQLEEKKISEDVFALEIQKLQGRLDKYDELVEILADKYARTDYDVIDEIDRQINEAIESGELDKADSLILSKGNLSDRHKKAIDWKDANIKRKAAIDEMMAQWNESEKKREAETDNLAEDYYHKFTIDVSRMKPVEAFAWLEKRLELDPDNFAWLLEASQYCKNYLADDDNAFALAKRALSAAYKTKQPLQIMNALNDAGILYARKNNFKEAEKCYKEVLRIAKSQKYDVASAVASTYNNLGYMENARNNRSKSLQYYEKSLEMSRDSIPDIALIALNNISTYYYSIDDYKTASDYIDKAISVAESINDKFSLITLYHNKAANLSETGRHEESIEYYQKALEIERALFANNHPLTARTLKNLSVAYNELSMYSKAYGYMMDALDMMIAVYGEDHPEVAGGYLSTGQLLNAVGRNALAKKYALAAEDIYKIFYPENSEVYVRIYNFLGVISDNPDEEIEYYKKAESICENLSLTKRQIYSTLCANLSAYYLKVNDAEHALDYINKALSLTEELVGKNTTTYIHMLNTSASVYEAMDDYSKALDIYKQTEALIINNYGPEHALLLPNYNNVGNINIHIHNFEAAREALLKALAIADKLYDEVSDVRMTVLGNIAMTYYRNKQYRETIPWIKKASDVRIRLITNNPMSQYGYLNYLYECYFLLAQDGSEEDVANLKEFLNSTIFKVLVAEGDYPARKQGLDGEYDLLEHQGWTLNDLEQFTTHMAAVKNCKELEIVMYRDSKIFDNKFNTTPIGVGFYLAPIDKDQRQKIVEAWRKWKDDNNR